MFNVTLEQGLSTGIIPELRSLYGTNQLPKPPKPSLIKMLWTQMTDFMVLLLGCASIISALRHELDSAISLWCVIVLNIIIGFSQGKHINYHVTRRI
jgi:Ca2+-transporting ATPase